MLVEPCRPGPAASLLRLRAGLRTEIDAPANQAHVLPSDRIAGANDHDTLASAICPEFPGKPRVLADTAALIAGGYRGVLAK